MAYETPLTIAEIVNDISANKYVLPSIQREFVWGTPQIERLFDSIMQGYPIGTFLFWELTNEQITSYTFYSFLQNYHEKNARHNPRINLAGNQNAMAVLDGQQRLTSIYIGLTGSYAYRTPRKQWKNDAAFLERRLYLNIVGPAKNDSDKYEFSFLTEGEAENDNEHYWFAVGNILNMPELGDVMRYLMSNIVYSYSKEQAEFANNALGALYKAVHEQRSISYYKVKNEQLDTVLQIFIRVNSGGTILSYSDLLLSIASAQWKELDARKEITDFVDEINSIGYGFNVNKDFVLKASLVLSDFRDIAFKVDNFNKTNMLKIEQNWQTIIKSVALAFQLVASFGFSRENLTSNNAVIPIAYYLMTIGNPPSFVTSTSTTSNRIKIKKWLSLALLKKAFSGQPDSILRPIREIIKKNGKNDFPIDEIVDELRGGNKTLIFTDDDIENLLDRKYGQPDTRTILMFLYPSLDYSNKFDIDHIYPKSKFTKSMLEKNGVSSDRVDFCMDHVNDLSNLQFLATIPNIEKQNKDFDDWFARICPTDSEKAQYRADNYLPKMDYTFVNFEHFIEERRQQLKRKLTEMLC